MKVKRKTFQAQLKLQYVGDNTTQTDLKHNINNIKAWRGE